MRHYTDSGEDVMTDPHPSDLDAANLELAARARALGFTKLGVASVDIPEDEQHLLRWLDEGFQDEMDYMRRHGTLRSRPADLVSGTVRVVSVRMDYWPSGARDAEEVLGDRGLGYVSR